ncbi:putative ankyrin repeat-containing protein [Halenospora varia]|nr:putative ankyrin repeat-containing protein [Halenospora varia]
MADPRDQPDHQEEIEGATPGEQLVEACRRGNTDLLQEIIDNAGGPERAAILLNDTKSVLGNHLYHEAALRGNYEIIDILLDQEGFECDPISRIEGDTPLHSAIRFINTLPQPISPHNLEFASSLLTMMTEAGSDPRIRNKAHLTAAQLCDPKLASLKNLLNDALDIVQNQGDFVVDEGDLAGGDYAGEEGDVGSGSDFDEEEAKGRRNGRA